MEETKKRTSPAEFFRQVKQEMGKVTWPTRKETGLTTVVVFIMCILAALFFLAVDYLLSHGIRLLLNI